MGLKLIDQEIISIDEVHSYFSSSIYKIELWNNLLSAFLEKPQFKLHIPVSIFEKLLHEVSLGHDLSDDPSSLLQNLEYWLEKQNHSSYWMIFLRYCFTHKNKIVQNTLKTLSNYLYSGVEE